MSFKGKGSYIVLPWILLSVFCIGFTHATTVRPGSTGSAKTRSTHTTSHHNSHSGTPVAANLPTQPVNASKVTQASSAVTSKATSSTAVPTTGAAAATTRPTTTKGTTTTTSTTAAATTTKNSSQHSTASSAASPGPTTPPIQPFSVHQTTSPAIVPSHGKSSNVSDTTTTKVPSTTTAATTTLPTSKPTKLSNASVSISGNATTAVSAPSIVPTTPATIKSTNSSSNATSTKLSTSTPVASFTSVKMTTPKTNASSPSPVTSVTRNVTTLNPTITTSAAQTAITSNTTQQPATQQHNITGISSSLKPASTLPTTTPLQSQMHVNHNQTKPSPAFTTGFSFKGTSSTNSSTFTAEITTDVSESSSTTTNSISSTGAFHLNVNPSVSSSATTTAAATGTPGILSSNSSSLSIGQALSSTQSLSNLNTSTVPSSPPNNKTSITTVSLHAATKTTILFNPKSSQTPGSHSTTHVPVSLNSSGQLSPSSITMAVGLNTTVSPSLSTKTSSNNNTMSTTLLHPDANMSTLSSVGTSSFQTLETHSTTLVSNSPGTSQSSNISATVWLNTTASSSSPTKTSTNSKTTQTPSLHAGTTMSSLSSLRTRSTNSSSILSSSISTSSASSLSTTNSSQRSSTLSTPVNTTPNVSSISTMTYPKQSSSTGVYSESNSSSGVTQSVTKSTNNVTANLTTTSSPGSPVKTTSGTKTVSTQVSLNTSHVSTPSSIPLSILSSPRTSPRASSTTNPLLTYQSSPAPNGTTKQSSTASTNPDPCASLVCHHGGTCVSHGTTANCTCSAGYTGRNCSVDINDCASSPCQNNGTCHDMVNDFNCSCVAGFTDKMCQTNIDDCAPNPCKHGRCIDLVNGYKCSCDPGYTGNTCRTDIDECSSNPCKNSANCTDHVGAFSCSCLPGWTGQQCQSNIDECSSSPCENGGICHDQINAFNCSCVLGFNGTTCQNNINDCVQSNCSNGATCVDGVNNYTCSCASGWEGYFCNKDIDECTRGTHECSKFATCSNKDGGYNCTCNNGFTGDGSTCTDIDECVNKSLHDCQHGACFNLFGNYSCLCDRGWEGYHCQYDIDECSRSKPCDPTAVCKNLNGSFSCDCTQGYRKEGQKCVYNVLLDIPTGLAQNTTKLHDDDNIVEIHLQQGLPYFGKVFYYAYISTNGYISLGKRYDIKSPPDDISNWPQDPPVIAPLWADIDPSKNGSGVYISRISYSDYNQEIVENLTDIYGFHAKFALMVTWKNVAPYPAAETFASEKADFQVIIVTNGTNTRMVFNYDQSHFTWKMTPGRHVAIGYSTEAKNKASILFSGDSFLNASSDSNINVTGRWVFDVSHPTNETTLAEARCRNVALRTSVVYTVSTLGWKYDPCPCTLAQAQRDNRFRYKGEDQGVVLFRSALAGSFNARRLCKYNPRGVLVTEGRLGGFLDMKIPDEEWSMKDIHDDCCVNSHLCYLFYQMNPPDTCRYYRPPSFASGWGDPHIQTLDGKQYTFNGRGEYVLLRTEEIMVDGKRSLEVQVRTELVTNNNSDSTVFVGVAAKNIYADIKGSKGKSCTMDFVRGDFLGPPHGTIPAAVIEDIFQGVGQIWFNKTGDIVEILLNRTSRAVDIWVNKKFNSTYRPSTNIDIEGNNFALHNQSDHLILAFPSGFSLQIEVSDILNIVGQAATNDSHLANMKGLLGNNDGNADNDFLSSTGDHYKSSSSEEQLWDFGTSWRLQNISESLFTYKSPSDFAFYNNNSIKPSTFISDVKNITDYLSSRCGSTITEKTINDTCGSNVACRVDMALTCSSQFGKRTMQTQIETNDNEKVAANNPPSIDGPAKFEIRDGENFTTYITISDDKDPAQKLTAELNSSSVFNVTKINATVYFISWRVNRSQIIDNPPYLRLTATDSMNATSEYWPSIEFCDCAYHLSGMCVKNYGDAHSGSTVRFMRWTCLCLSGWTGERCETKLKPCLDINPCYNASSCTEKDGEPRCGACPKGLAGDGNKCHDVNECEAVISPCSQTCTNTRGSYFCSCMSGYRLDSDNSSCSDVNECETGANNCSLAGNEVCVNIAGSYECQCRPGFINVSNSCQQVLSQYAGLLVYNAHISQGNEHATLKEFLWSVFNRTMSLVSVEIHNVNTRMRLRKMKAPSIEKEFILSSDKPTKPQTVEDTWNNFTHQDMRCDENKCELLVGDNGLTVYVERSKVYSDHDNMVCSIENKRCDNVSTHCTSNNGIISCSCRTGFSAIDNVLDRCADIDECQSSPSPCTGGTCINTPGNYTCRCPSGYGYISGKCTDLCSSSPCLNGGTCVHGQNENEFVCKCDDKWAGLTCERENEEASRLRTALIAVGASVGGLCFLMLMALLGMCRRSRQKHKAYLHQRAMSSINGYESSKLQFHDEPYDDDPAEPSAFVIPRPQVTGQYEMQRTNSDERLVQQDDTAAKEGYTLYTGQHSVVTSFSDPAKPSATGSSDKEEMKGKENPSFLHSEGSQKDERRRSKNPYEYF